MPAASKTWVLDTSALLALKQDEPGAAEVEGLLRDHPADVFVCFMSLMEYYYLHQQKLGETAARKAYLELKGLPLQVVESDEELALAAARLKAAAKLSMADAWIAAAAERLGAVLVHKDSDFERLKGKISLLALPYKVNRS